MFSSGAQVLSPATGETIATLPTGTGSDAQAAIARAADAFPQWSTEAASGRARALLAWAAAIRQHREDVAQIMTAECGKPLRESRGEIAAGVASIEWFAAEAVRCAAHAALLAAPARLRAQQNGDPTTV